MTTHYLFISLVLSTMLAGTGLVFHHLGYERGEARGRILGREGSFLMGPQLKAEQAWVFCEGHACDASVRWFCSHPEYGGNSLELCDQREEWMLIYPPGEHSITDSIILP